MDSNHEETSAFRISNLVILKSATPPKSRENSLIRIVFVQRQAENQQRRVARSSNPGDTLDETIESGGATSSTGTSDLPPGAQADCWGMRSRISIRWKSSSARAIELLIQIVDHSRFLVSTDGQPAVLPVATPACQ